MHIEVLVEDSSGEVLLNLLLPRLLGPHGLPHTWRLHAHKGIGRIPRNLKGGDVAKRIILDQLPRLIAGYGKTPGVDAVVVVVDTDNRNCVTFLAELKALAGNHRCGDSFEHIVPAPGESSSRPGSRLERRRRCSTRRPRRRSRCLRRHHSRDRRRTARRPAPGGTPRVPDLRDCPDG